MQTTSVLRQLQNRGKPLGCIPVVPKSTPEHDAFDNMVFLEQTLLTLKKLHTDPDKHKTGICDSEKDNLLNALRIFADRARAVSKVEQFKGSKEDV